MPALAVMPHLCRARSVRTGATWMTEGLAAVLAGLKLLHAPLAAPLFQEGFNTFETLAFRVTSPLADVSTAQRDAARFTTVRTFLMTVNSILSFLSACTSFCDRLQARRAVAEVTLKSARMSTG